MSLIIFMAFTAVFGVLVNSLEGLQGEYENYSVVETVEDADVEEPAGEITAGEDVETGEVAPDVAEEPAERPDCVEVDSDGRPVVNYNC